MPESLYTPNDVKRVRDELVKKQFQTFYLDKFEYTCHKGEKHEADWRSMMDLYFRCARMLRKKDDPLDYRLLLDEYGVDAE